MPSDLFIVSLEFDSSKNPFEETRVQAVAIAELAAEETHAASSGRVTISWPPSERDAARALFKQLGDFAHALKGGYYLSYRRTDESRATQVQGRRHSRFMGEGHGRREPKAASE